MTDMTDSAVPAVLRAVPPSPPRGLLAFGLAWRTD
jgi:hypothetical protein